MWRRRIIIVAIIAGFAFAIAYGFMPGPVQVDTAVVSRGPLSVVVEEEGKTRLIDRYIVSAPVTGYARRVALKVGAIVAQGEVVAELEPRRSQVLDRRSRAEAEARVAAAAAALKSVEANRGAARADADYGIAELERSQKLFRDGYLSRDALDRATAEERHRSALLRSADFNVDVARYEWEAAETALAYSTGAEAPGGGEKVAVRAPVEGRLLKVHHESEGLVNEGQPLVEIGNARALEIEVDVLSEDAVRIKAGTKVLFERWGGDTPLEGVVKIVEPAGFTKISALGVEEQRVLVISDITSPSGAWERLGDGYRVEARFLLWEGDDILQVPSSALFRYGDKRAVFVVEGERARRRIVETGHRGGLITEVVSGLSEGEIVITHPDDIIDDGTRVRER